MLLVSLFLCWARIYVRAAVRKESCLRLTEAGRFRAVWLFSRSTTLSLLRRYIDYIVTAHGIASLSGKSGRQRVETLIAVPILTFEMS